LAKIGYFRQHFGKTKEKFRREGYQKKLVGIGITRKGGFKNQKKLGLRKEGRLFRNTDGGIKKVWDNKV